MCNNCPNKNIEWTRSTATPEASKRPLPAPEHKLYTFHEVEIACQSAYEEGTIDEIREIVKSLKKQKHICNKAWRDIQDVMHQRLAVYEDRITRPPTN